MNDRYQSPLSERYASKEMQYIFSPDKKFKTWRKLWIALAETERELGLDIGQEQIDELKAHMDDINYDVARERERLVRHDVMSHVYAYGQQCPKAKGIIHLGATSCYVGDNTDIIIMAEALKLVKRKLINVMAKLAGFADAYKDQPTLAFTHFQPAQPTTVGKRAALWLHDLSLDLEDLEYVQSSLKLLGSKGTTGTQASFLELFDGDHDKCRRADEMIAAKMGFETCYPVSGQTYSRKIDTRVINVLAGIAQSAHKFSNDVRLLQHLLGKAACAEIADDHLQGYDLHLLHHSLSIVQFLDQVGRHPLGLQKLKHMVGHPVVDGSFSHDGSFFLSVKRSCVIFVRNDQRVRVFGCKNFFRFAFIQQFLFFHEYPPVLFLNSCTLVKHITKYNTGRPEIQYVLS